MTTITMTLVGGEKDGLELTLSDDDRPDVYYALPNADEDKIKKTRGNEAKRELRDKLAVLAYRRDPAASTADRFVMRRCPELDKVGMKEGP